MQKYDVSKSYIELIIYDKKVNKGKPCVRCGKLISTYKWGRNNGVCDNCISKQLKNHTSYEMEQFTDDETIVDQEDEKKTGD